MASAAPSADMPVAGSKPLNKVLLVSIDGWGLSSVAKGNAILNAHTPNMDALSSAPHLHARIDASGLSVGLPEGVMGNSEVGHLTMGAGRVEFQDLVRINAALARGELATNPAVVLAINRTKAGNGRVHLLGLLSDGAVHSHISHLFVFLEVLKAAGVPHAFVHVFADGRDTPPTTAKGYLAQLEAFMAKIGYGSIATVQGRYYAMDRDKRWERVAIAYEALVAGAGDKVETVASDALAAKLDERYAAGEKDEFLRPMVLTPAGGVQPGLIADGDTLFFLNFRSDRMREITSVFAKMSEALPSKADEVLPFATAHRRKNILTVQMTQYDEKIVLPTVFPPQSMVNSLPEWIAKHDLPQFHTAETEKYAHVTFFFAGGKEVAYPREDRELIQSPQVATYDLAPEMSMTAVGDSLVRALDKQTYPLIMTNLAAPDMVGHTGHYDKAVIACAHCDKVIGRLIEACKKNGYILVVTADHGNAEEMYAEDGVSPKTSHTTNLIPLLVSLPPECKGKVEWTAEVQALADKGEKVPQGGLSDVAPTVLALMGLAVPKEMTGKPMITLTQQA